MKEWFIIWVEAALFGFYLSVAYDARHALGHYSHAANDTETPTRYFKQFMGMRG